MENLVNTLAILLIVLFIAPIDGLGANKQQFCNSYADSAVKQYNQGKQHNLSGIVPPAWSNDRNGHYNWCLVVPENVANSEHAKRQAYLDKPLVQNATEKNIVTGTVVGVVSNKGVGSVAATPISIPRPIKVEKIHANTPGTIEKINFISIDKNTIRIRLYYKVDPSVASSLYGGAFLYDINLKATNAGYKPTREYRTSEGSIDVFLVLPLEPFESATLEAFLMHSKKVIVKKYFKLPFRWNGVYGSSANSKIDGKLKSTAGLGKSDIPVEHELPIGLDPGLGP